MRSPVPSCAQSGFTLIETLAALALVGLIFSALAQITSQWLPSWNRSFANIQRSESISIALERMSADIGAAQFVRPDRSSKRVLFDGAELSVTFVRSSLGPNSRPGLDVVRIAESTDERGFVLTRSQTRFTPGVAASQRTFGDPVVLLRSPYRLTFSYAGDTGAGWNTSWRDEGSLPRAVLMTVRDAATDRLLGVSRVAVVHVNASADSTCGDNCVVKANPQPTTPGQQPSAGEN
jgi:general secretion pathway protein J